MSETFKVGDICEIIMVGLLSQHLLGTECEIIRPSKRPGYQWTVSMAGDTWDCVARALRKKRPPAYPDMLTAGEWDKCHWKPPTTVRA